MGISSQIHHGVVENTNSSPSSYECLWRKVLEAQAKRVKDTKRCVKGRRQIRVLMKRRVGSRRGSNGIQRRVKTLKSLIPNSDSNMGLDGLFRETANYILSLQTRVRVMQVMVKVLTGTSD
ncbi:hypothetical protein RJT34_24781 [Clitoria ternatea]|uniref:Transcription factor UPBEAT1 n=1 Tax=Clitoria ternatea TaxID=43366 RepID=A0AAN9FQK7_CLITE